VRQSNYESGHYNIGTTIGWRKGRIEEGHSAAQLPRQAQSKIVHGDTITLAMRFIRLGIAGGKPSSLPQGFVEMKPAGPMLLSAYITISRFGPP